LRTAHRAEQPGTAEPLSRKILNYVAGLIRRRRKSIGSRCRRLDPGQQGLLVLAYLRKGETFADLGAGFGGNVGGLWRIHGRASIAGFRKH
jgi:Helix-turn-helix of DDE superfamily endonuclease